MRRPIMAGNWKMYKSPSETAAYFSVFNALVESCQHTSIVICPPFPSLSVALQTAQETDIEIGAQNCSPLKEGAYTGEVAAGMLADAGVKWVIVGHSERRQYFAESDDDVNRKAVAVLQAGLRPIICVGERAEEHEAGRTRDVLVGHFTGGIAPLTPEQVRDVVIAYEPVWAIGTGKTATPEIAANAHGILRELLTDRFGADIAAEINILYGGSVKPDNVAGLMAQHDIDGALVGGASLDPQSFAKICNYR